MVYEASHVVAGRVAVKMLGVCADVGAQTEFLLEASRLWRMSHERIVAVVGLVQHPHVRLLPQKERALRKELRKERSEKER